MRIAVTGASGQLGRAVVAAFARAHEVVPLQRPAADVRDPAIIDRIVAVQPDVVINCAAMTHVDGCALDPEAAYVANALGPRRVALACRRAGAAMVQISTNEVFDGEATRPYHEFDQPAPINPYGASKLAGEREVQSLLERHFIVRTAWLFGHGGNNFVEKILRLAEQGGPLRIVAEEEGSPTYCEDVAQVLVELVGSEQYGVYHVANAGMCSRFAFARAIVAQAGLAVPVEPITAAEFVRPSRPPRRSALRSLILPPLRPWEEALAAYLARRREVG